MLMDPADIVQNPDELSIVTYLSYFQQYADEHFVAAEPQEEEETPVVEPEEPDDTEYEITFSGARYKCKFAGKGLHEGVIGTDGEFIIKVLDKNSERAADVPVDKIFLKIDPPAG